MLITLILLRFARRHLSTSRLLLAGVALGIICSALMTWAVYFSTSFDLRQLMYWMMGGFGGVDWRLGWLMVLLVPVILWAGVQSQPLNILALGETSARQLGMPIGVWRNALVIAIGWLVGVSVALAGGSALSGWLSRTCCVCVASPTIESYFPPRQWPVRQRCWWRISSPGSP